MKRIIFFALYLIPLLSISQPTNFLVLTDTETIKIPNSDNINMTISDNRTVELWFKADDASETNSDYQVLYEEGGRTNGFNIFIYKGQIYSGAWSESNSPKWYGTWFRNNILSNTWYHVALVLDGSNSSKELKWYLNGTLQDTRTGYKVNKHSGDVYLNSKGVTVFPKTSASWNTGSKGEYFKATSDQGNPNGDGFAGAVGFVRVWKSARSSIEINANMNTVYTNGDLNNNPDYLVAFLNGDFFEYVGDGGVNKDTSGETQGVDGTPLPKTTPTDFIWDGYQDTDWNNTMNWVSYTVPDDGDNVSIESERYVNKKNPVIPAGNYYYGKFEVSSASTLDLSNAVIISNTGVFTNNGNVSIGSNANVVANGVINNSTISVDGELSSSTILTNTAGNTLDFNSGSTSSVVTELHNYGVFNSDNSSTRSDVLENYDGATFTSTSSSTTVDSQLNNSGSFSLGCSSTLSVNSTMGVFTNSATGEFTIKSSSSGTGSLITNGTISNLGDIKVKRYINEGTWQLLSSPTDNEKSKVVDGSFLNNFDEGEGEFHAIKSRGYKLVEGDGYVVKWKNEFTSGTNPLVFSNDKPNTGDVTIPLNITAEDIDPDDGFTYSNTYFDLPVGFNLVGNPYPSRINWNMLYNRNSGVIDATYYRYKDNSGNGNGSWEPYIAGFTVAVDADSIISMGQGFGVVLSDNTTASSLTFSNAVRTHNKGEVGFGKNASTSSLSFNLSSYSNGISDNIRFRINENSTSDYDGEFDAYKINSFGNTPTPSFISTDSKKLAICQQPVSESVDLGFNMAVSGEVIFSISDASDFTELVLEDKQEGTFTNLLESDYTFAYSDEDAETGRFTIHFNQETLSEIEELTGMKIYSNSSSIVLNSDKSLSNVELELYNISGQKVLSKHFDTLKAEEINTSLNGVYILKLNSDNGVYTSKLILN